MDSHQGAVLLYSAETGELQAVMNASAITAIRTAAASGLATDLLARKDAKRLAMVGTGVEARAHLEAIAAVRPLERCRVASRNFAHAQRFESEFSSRFGFPVRQNRKGRPWRRRDRPQLAKQPVVERHWIAPGAHINAVGRASPPRRDRGETVWRRACLPTGGIRDDRAGDLMQADRLIGTDRLRANSTLATGAHAGRLRRQITLFESLGIGIEDVACAA
jgi:ornithine cyclodeaminase